MLPPPNNLDSRRFSFALVARNVSARLWRWWHVLLLLTVVLWLSTSTFTPRRFRFRFFKSSRPVDGPRPPPMRLPDGDLWAGRAHEVRKAFVHAYTGYQTHALPYDELRPMTGGRINKCVMVHAEPQEDIDAIRVVSTDGV
jgi:mannosyl-oligosaccharide alpha-1,2-mannosidase